MRLARGNLLIAAAILLPHFAKAQSLSKTDPVALLHTVAAAYAAHTDPCDIESVEESVRNFHDEICGKECMDGGTIPPTVLIDAQGTLRYNGIGSSEEELRRAIETLNPEPNQRSREAVTISREPPRE